MARIAVMPEAWLLHADVGADEIAVLAVLALHAGRDQTCFPSQGHLATILGRSRSWVCRVIARLVEVGLVVQTRRQRHDGGDRSSLYQLVAPPQESKPVPEEHTGCAGPHTVKAEKESNRGHTASAHDEQSARVVALQPTLTELPEDWQPNDQDLIWAMERFPTADLHQLTERFTLRCRARGYRYRDWSAAWRAWLADDLRPPAPGRSVAWKGRGADRQVAAETRLAAWAGVAARAMGGGHAAAA